MIDLLPPVPQHMAQEPRCSSSCDPSSRATIAYNSAQHIKALNNFAEIAHHAATSQKMLAENSDSIRTWIDRDVHPMMQANNINIDNLAACAERLATSHEKLAASHEKLADSHERLTASQLRTEQRTETLLKDISAIRTSLERISRIFSWCPMR